MPSHFSESYKRPSYITVTYTEGLGQLNAGSLLFSLDSVSPYELTLIFLALLVVLMTPLKSTYLLPPLLLDSLSMPTV